MLQLVEGLFSTVQDCYMYFTAETTIIAPCLVKECVRSDICKQWRFTRIANIIINDPGYQERSLLQTAKTQIRLRNSLIRAVAVHCIFDNQ